MTLLRLALLSHRGGFLVVTAVSVFAGIANALGYVQIAGTDPAVRAIFARQMELVGQQFTYMLPKPLELDTLSGYLHWRYYGAMTIVYGFWAVMAASGAGRGDEERGLVEQWLAAGVSRVRYLATRAVAFAVVVAASVVVQAVALAVPVALTNEPLSNGALALQGIALCALPLSIFGLALLVAQLATTRRGAGGAAGILVVVLFLLNSASRNGSLREVEWLSPFWMYERSAPLLRAGTLDLPGTLAMLAIAVIAVAVSAWAFAARDLGASLLRAAARTARASFRPSRDPLLRLPVLAGLERQRGWVVGWALGIALLAAYLVSLTRTMVDAFLAIPTFRIYMERLGAPTYDTFVGVIWGSTALLLLSLLAIFQVSSWVADDAEGRLEAVLAQPASRTAVVLDRVAGLLVAVSLVALAGSIGVVLSASAADIRLSPDRLAVASLLMPTVPLAIGALGAVVASWRPRLAVPVLTAVAIYSYFAQQFAPIFDWPKWVERTSIFALYGTPLSSDVDVTGITILVAIAVLGTAVAVTLMRTRDVGA